MTTDKPRSTPLPPVPAGPAWLASLAIPAAVFAACLAVDVSTTRLLAAEAGRASLLTLFGAILQILVILAVVPWWSAELVGRSSFGVIIAAARVVAMTFSTTILLLMLSWLQVHPAPWGVLKAQLVVLGAGFLVVGTAALLRMILRNASSSAVLTSLGGLLVAASPFWGNVPIQCACATWKPFVVDLVVKTTPISACSSAVGYDLFRGPVLYVTSAVSDYQYVLPTWWFYALVAGASGILLMEIAAFIRSRSGKV